MDCALWLNKRKIFSAEDIAANFDIAAIRGYFLGGSLTKWLKANNGEHYAAALEKVDPSSENLNDILSEIFGQINSAAVHQHDEQLITFIDTIKGGCAPANGSAVGSAHSMQGNGSYRLANGSYSFGSYQLSASGGSYRYGSYNFGNYKGFSLWEWEWEWYLSSFRKRGGSFSGFMGSYNFGSYSLTGYGYGSFNISSYRFGGSGSYNFGSLGYYNFGGSFRFGMEALGSYKGVPLGSMGWMSADEYDEIMYRTLGICPLDRFGYGIHII